jgi:hypothetical protein
MGVIECKVLTLQKNAKNSIYTGEASNRTTNKNDQRKHTKRVYKR